jgi:hypothetical protein
MSVLLSFLAKSRNPGVKLAVTPRDPSTPPRSALDDPRL